MSDKEMAPKDLLFEAITNIKKGHNKPNTQRICSHLSKKYSITASRCIKAINHYVVTGDIEVVNPGAATTDLSYRVATTDSDPLSSLDDIPSLQGSMINKFMAELIINEPNYLNDGVPPARLVSFVAEKQPELTRREIIDSIRAELNSRNLDMFTNGNYGYCPVDSSDEEPMSEPEDKRRQVTPAASPTTRTKAAPPPATGVPGSAEKSSKAAPPKPTVMSKPGAAAAEKPNAERSNEKAQSEARLRGARLSRPDEKRDSQESKENLKREVKSGTQSRREEGGVERERKEDWEEGGGGSRRRWKRRKGWARDAHVRPGSKDFKVDLSLERQARKRKERKIFDPSADDSKRIRRGRNGSKGEESAPAATGGANGAAGAKKLVSPAKKSPLAGTSVKVGSSMSVQCPPGGRAPITPLVPSSVCYLCQSYGKRTKGVPEKLLSCLKCSTSKAHITCINDARGPNEKPMAPSANNAWTCKKCNMRCVYCNEEKPGIFILECIECRAGFHVPCHRSLIPPLAKPSPLIPTLFKCVRCVPPLQRSQPSPAVADKLQASQSPSTSDVDVVELESPSAPPKVTVTPLKTKVSPADPATESSSVRPPPPPDQTAVSTPAALAGPKLAEPRGPDPFSHMGPLDPAVPDVRGWSAAKVYDYLRRYLRPALCQPVIDDALDGHALLLMRRTDCVSSLGLPLGHAVLLWAHIRRLQTKRSDIVAMNYCEE